MIGKSIIKCPFCHSSNIKKDGKRKSKFQITQKYSCKSCSKNFSDKKLEHKAYPAKIILNTISYYNLSHNQNKVSKIISQKFKLRIPQRTISEWINQYKNICTYNKLRPEAIKLYNSKNIIFKQTLHNIQPYTFQYHKAKLYLLFHNKLYNNQFHNISHFYEPLKAYLEKITTDKFPHHIFTYNKEENQNNGQRASQIKFTHLKINHIKKQNQANELAKLALNLAKTNKDRHQAIQNFFLINDSTTIATEIPVYLTNDDIKYFRKRNFTLNLENYATPITGHIDLLQIRNGLIHILDYKPNADKREVQNQAIQQLTIYALALASRTKLPLSDFKCTFFDESNYFEFFPLHGVYAKI